MSKIINNYVIKKNKIEKEQKELLEERKKKVEESKDKSKNELKSILLEFNKKQVNIKNE